MGNNRPELYYHMVFSTKHCKPWIVPEIEDRIWSCLDRIARENEIAPLQIGGDDDHVHLLLGVPPTIPIGNVAELIKEGSSAWIHDTFPDLQQFAWQDGYGVFTVSKSSVPDARAYILNQRDHHRVVTFETEYLSILKLHGIPFDEQSAFD